MRYPEYILKLMANLKKLPGVGSKTAERFAFHMLSWSDAKIDEFAAALTDVKEKFQTCATCGALLEKECLYCARNTDSLCVVASIKDIFSIEATRSYKGVYHVLGGIFSPIEGKFPNEERIAKLKERIVTLDIKEVILALDATLEGDATALYLKKELTYLPIHLSRLALGLPMGSSLDYIDEGTLARALLGRDKY